MSGWVAGATVVSSLVGAKASKSAASTQAAAADRAAELQKEQFERQVELQAPFREAGVRALPELEAARAALALARSSRAFALAWPSFASCEFLPALNANRNMTPSAARQAATKPPMSVDLPPIRARSAEMVICAIPVCRPAYTNIPCQQRLPCQPPFQWRKSIQGLRTALRPRP